jgi:hypothetical protein
MIKFKLINKINSFILVLIKIIIYHIYNIFKSSFNYLFKNLFRKKKFELITINYTKYIYQISQ